MHREAGLAAFVTHRDIPRLPGRLIPSTVLKRGRTLDLSWSYMRIPVRG